MSAPDTRTGEPRVVLRPLATPLPLGFLALLLATVPLSAVQLGWIPPTEGAGAVGLRDDPGVRPQL